MQGHLRDSQPLRSTCRCSVCAWVHVGTVYATVLCCVVDFVLLRCRRDAVCGRASKGYRIQTPHLRYCCAARRKAGTVDCTYCFSGSNEPLGRHTGNVVNDSHSDAQPLLRHGCSLSSRTHKLNGCMGSRPTKTTHLAVLRRSKVGRKCVCDSHRPALRRRCQLLVRIQVPQIHRDRRQPTELA